MQVRRRRRGAARRAQTFDGQRYLFRDIDDRARRQGRARWRERRRQELLLKVLVGADAPESGDVRLTKDVQLAYVEQDPTLPDGALAEEWLRAAGLRRAARVAAAEVEEGGDDAAAAARLARASDAMDERGRSKAR